MWHAEPCRKTLAIGAPSLHVNVSMQAFDIQTIIKHDSICHNSKVTLVTESEFRKHCLYMSQ